VWLFFASRIIAWRNIGQWCAATADTSPPYTISLRCTSIILIIYLLSYLLLHLSHQHYSHSSIYPYTSLLPLLTVSISHLSLYIHHNILTTPILLYHILSFTLLYSYFTTWWLLPTLPYFLFLFPTLLYLCMTTLKSIAAPQEKAQGGLATGLLRQISRRRTEMSLLACKQSKVFQFGRQRRIANHTDGCLFRFSDWSPCLPKQG
jgi:hypothetical protein